jgi:hypothetical protein
MLFFGKPHHLVVMLWGGESQNLGLTGLLGPKFVVSWAITVLTLGHMIFSEFLIFNSLLPGIFKFNR